MIRFLRFAAAAGTFGLAGVLAVPAAAQYANEYAPPKLMHQGPTQHPIAGTGVVVVQVQVFANGGHKATHVLRSTNSGDNAAALDIAQSSTYHVARRGGKPVTSFYDFTLRFTGKSVAADTGSGGSGPTAQIARMIRAGNYSGAKAMAQQQLSVNGSDPVALQQLGTADYFLKDYVGSADAFTKVPTISRQYAQVAAHAFASAAVAQSVLPAAAVAYAKRSLALGANANSYYALGIAELNANDAADAVTYLKRARDLAFADPKTDRTAKLNLDSQLFRAYSQAGDTADAQTVAAQIRQIDPSSTLAQRSAGNDLLQQGVTAAKAGKVSDALSAFNRAASSGDPLVAVTAEAQAAFLVGNPPESSGVKPDFSQAKSYADKAIAINPNDAFANFAEGFVLAGQYITGGSTKGDLKTQSMTYLNKASSLAQSAGNTGLYLQIQNFIKATFK